MEIRIPSILGHTAIPHPTIDRGCAKIRRCRVAQWTAQCSGCARRMQQREQSCGTGSGSGCAHVTQWSRVLERMRTQRESLPTLVGAAVVGRVGGRVANAVLGSTQAPLRLCRARVRARGQGPSTALHTDGQCKSGRPHPVGTDRRRESHRASPKVVGGAGLLWVLTWALVIAHA